MGVVRTSSPSKASLLRELAEELHGSLDLRQVMAHAYPLLTRIVPVDHGALCVSSGRPDDYEWIVADLPDGTFSGYRDLAPHDFVRSAVVRSPDVVLRDEDMITRPALARNQLYLRWRELGVRVEQVMAVLVDIGDGAHGGVTLHRDRRTPFSDQERRVLQGLVRPFARAIRNCRRYQGAASLAEALGKLLSRRGAGALLATSTGTEIARSERAAELLDRWFPASERDPGGLPAIVTRALARASASGRAEPASLQIERLEADLRVSLDPMPSALGGAMWCVEIEEIPRVAGLPRSWRSALSPREQAVAARTLSGWDRRTVAQDLGCSEETVKTHLSRVFQKLGVEGRAGLIRRARHDG